MADYNTQYEEERKVLENQRVTTPNQLLRKQIEMQQLQESYQPYIQQQQNETQEQNRLILNQEKSIEVLRQKTETTKQALNRFVDEHRGGQLEKRGFNTDSEYNYLVGKLNSYENLLGTLDNGLKEGNFYNINPSEIDSVVGSQAQNYAIYQTDINRQGRREQLQPTQIELKRIESLEKQIPILKGTALELATSEYNLLANKYGRNYSLTDQAGTFSPNINVLQSNRMQERAGAVSVNLKSNQPNFSSLKTGEVYITPMLGNQSILSTIDYDRTGKLVTGYSMSPNIKVGTKLAYNEYKNQTLNVGDIIRFKYDKYKDENPYTVHRIVGFADDGTIITRGDNNPQGKYEFIKKNDITDIVVGKFDDASNVIKINSPNQTSFFVPVAGLKPNIDVIKGLLSYTPPKNPTGEKGTRNDLIPSFDSPYNLKSNQTKINTNSNKGLITGNLALTVVPKVGKSSPENLLTPYVPEKQSTLITNNFVPNFSTPEGEAQISYRNLNQKELEEQNKQKLEEARQKFVNTPTFKLLGNEGRFVLGTSYLASRRGEESPQGFFPVLSAVVETPFILASDYLGERITSKTYDTYFKSRDLPIPERYTPKVYNQVLSALYKNAPPVEGEFEPVVFSREGVKGFTSGGILGGSYFLNPEVTATRFLLGGASSTQELSQGKKLTLSRGLNIGFASLELPSLARGLKVYKLTDKINPYALKSEEATFNEKGRELVKGQKVESVPSLPKLENKPQVVSPVNIELLKKIETEGNFPQALKSNPKLPQVPQFEQGILPSIIKEGAILTGGKAQNILLKESRLSQDYDVIAKNQKELGERIVKESKGKYGLRETKSQEVGGGVRMDLYKVYDKATGKTIVDISNINTYTNPKIINVEGLNILSPELLIHGKVDQIIKLKKLKKVSKDIEYLTGGEYTAKEVLTPTIKTSKPTSLLLKNTPSQLATQADMIATSGKVETIITASPKPLPFRYNPFTNKATFTVEKQEGTSILRSFSEGSELALFFAGEELGTKVPQAYTYYAGLKGSEGSLFDVLTGEAKFTIGKNKPTITIGKEYVEPVNLELLNKPITQAERQETLKRLEDVRQGKIKGLTSSDVERLLESYGGVDKLTLQRRLALATNQPNKIVSGIGALSGLRSEYEKIGTVGTKFERVGGFDKFGNPIKQTLRGKVGKLAGTLSTKLSMGDYFIRLPSGEKLEVQYLKKVIPLEEPIKSQSKIKQVLQKIKQTSEPYLSGTYSTSEELPKKYYDVSKGLRGGAESISLITSSKSTPNKVISSKSNNRSGDFSEENINTSFKSQNNLSQSNIILSNFISNKNETSSNNSLSDITSNVSKVSNVSKNTSEKSESSLSSNKNIRSLFSGFSGRGSERGSSSTTNPPTIKTKLDIYASSEYKAKKIKELLRRKAYQLQIKRKGKFFDVGQPTTYGKAAKRGASSVLSNLGRTFRLTPKGSTSEEDIPFNLSSSIFRNYQIKGKQKIQLLDTFIQKSGIKEQGIKTGALTSFGERREIQLAKKSKKQGGFNLFK